MFDLPLGDRGWECENAVFHPQLIESMGGKPVGMKDQLYLLKKNHCISG